MAEEESVDRKAERWWQEFKETKYMVGVSKESYLWLFRDAYLRGAADVKNKVIGLMETVEPWKGHYQLIPDVSVKAAKALGLTK